jgi:hypothetical protein
METKNLFDLTEFELKDLAKNNNIKFSDSISKESLIELIQTFFNTTENFISEFTKEPSGLSFKDTTNLSSSSIVNEKKSKVNIEKHDYFNPEKGEGNLPKTYGTDQIIIMAKNPTWGYAYWEITEKTINELKERYGDNYINNKWYLRVFDITEQKIENAPFFDLLIEKDMRHRFINFQKPNRVYTAKVGILANNDFNDIITSNVIKTPSSKPSNDFTEEWMVVNEYYEKIFDTPNSNELFDEKGKFIGYKDGKVFNESEKELYEKYIQGLVGFDIKFLGSSENIISAKLRKLEEKPNRAPEMNTRADSSSHSFSSDNLVKNENIENEKTPKNKNFWLNVWTELILYGQTQKDATVTVCNKEVKLDEDGKFKIHFELPDSYSELPVKAVNKDKDDWREIMPIVEKLTKYIKIE